MVIEVKPNGAFPHDRHAIQRALDKAKELPSGEWLTVKLGGGTWDGNATNPREYRRVMKFTHARNITLKNTVIRNTCGKHVVRGCTFRNYEFYALNIFRYDGVELSNNVFENNGTDLRQLDSKISIGGNRRGRMTMENVE